MTPPGIMKVSPKEGVFQFRANSNLPSPVFKVFSVFSNIELPSVSERESQSNISSLFFFGGLLDGLSYVFIIYFLKNIHEV